jgi:RNA polymerase sigma factor (sigma-70 family)
LNKIVKLTAPNFRRIGISETPSAEKLVSISSADVPWESYSRALRSHFRRHLNSDVDLDDLVQEVFAKLAALPTDHRVDYPIAYIFRIASNILIDRSRGRQHPLDHSVSLDSDGMFSARAEQEDWRHYQDLEQILDVALSTLSDKCRDAFILKRYHDMDTPQIAVQLQISQRMVQKHIANALVTIHEHVRVATTLPHSIAGGGEPS